MPTVRGAAWLAVCRFNKVPRLTKELRLPTPADRGPGQPWRQGTTPPTPIPDDRPAADIRVGYVWNTRG